MTLPFGTRVSLNISRSGRVGVVTGSGAALDEAPLYAVVWEDPHPGTRPLCHAAAELTVVESPAESALREIRRMLDLPSDADPAAIVEALRSCVADKGRVLGRPTREDPPASVEESVWGRVLEDGSIAGVPRPHRITPRVRDDVAVAYIVGPDPALLIPEKT